MTGKNIARIAIFAVLTYIAGMISIPVGPVPITLQTSVVTLTGLILKPREALLAMVIHLLLKLFLNGFQIIIGPSFGFLVGFILAAYLASLYVNNYGTSRKHVIIGVFIASIVPYIIGLPYMAFILNYVNGMDMALFEILKVGMLIFIPGDILKAVLAYFLFSKLKNRI